MHRSCGNSLTWKQVRHRLRELVHLLALNRGRVFKSFLHAYLPDWRERERRLRASSYGGERV